MVSGLLLSHHRGGRAGSCLTAIVFDLRLVDSADQRHARRKWWSGDHHRTQKQAPAQSIKIAQNEGIFICAGRMHINALREQVQFKVKLKPAYARHRSVV